AVDAFGAEEREHLMVADVDEQVTQAAAFLDRDAVEAQRLETEDVDVEVVGRVHVLRRQAHVTESSAHALSLHRRVGTVPTLFEIDVYATLRGGLGGTSGGAGERPRRHRSRQSCSWSDPKVSRRPRWRRPARRPCRG